MNAQKALVGCMPSNILLSTALVACQENWKFLLVHLFPLQFALLETVSTAIFDRFPNLRERKTLVVLAISVFGYVGGLIFTTRVRPHYTYSWCNSNKKTISTDSHYSDSECIMQTRLAANIYDHKCFHSSGWNCISLEAEIQLVI